MEEIHNHKENHHRDDDDPFNFPPGVRFCPRDEELIRCYLQRKVMNQILPPNKIPDVNLYKYSPDDLSAIYPPIGEKEWYFFTPRDKKYPNGSRPNRAAGNGFWKATGADKPIHDQDKVVVGLRKALVYYQGKAPKGDKTNWIMHEYKVNESPPPKSRAEGGDGDDMRLDDWVLCRIYNKVEKYAPKNELVKSGWAASPSPPPAPLPPYDETEYSLYHHHGMENLLNPDLVGSFMYDNPLCDLEYVMSCPLEMDE